MSLRIRRGTEAQRTGLGYTFDPGELVYTTDSKKLYIGDGVTSGGQHVLASSAGTGLYWNPTTQQLDISGANLSTAYVQEDPTNLYYTPERAQDAVSMLFTHGDGHSGISFLYDDVNNKIYATVTGGGSGTTLPGNATGYLHNDGTGTLAWLTNPLTSISQDTTPQLGGNLSLNSHSITGNGNININGEIRNSNTSINNNIIETTTNIVIQTNNRTSLDLTSISDGTLNGMSRVRLNGSSGTINNPTVLTPGDYLGGYLIHAYSSTNNDYSVTGGIISKLSNDYDDTYAFPSADLVFVTGTNSSQPISFTFNNKGILNAPVFKATSYDTGSEPSNPEKGWIIFNSTTNQFNGWNGTSWAILG